MLLRRPAQVYPSAPPGHGRSNSKEVAQFSTSPPPVSLSLSHYCYYYHYYYYRFDFGEGGGERELLFCMSLELTALVTRRVPMMAPFHIFAGGL